MKVIKERTIKYRLVVPETDGEKKELERLIHDSQGDVNIDLSEFVFLKVDDDVL